jgi:hypothetical protein
MGVPSFTVAAIFEYPVNSLFIFCAVDKSTSVAKPRTVNGILKIAAPA